METLLHPRSVLVALLVTAACSSGNNTAPVTQGQLAIVSGNSQVAQVSSVLQPYQVKVSDQNGSAVSGVYVHWKVTSGGGGIAPDSAATDGAGISTAVATLGSTPGQQSVTARLDGYSGSPVTFTSQGTAGQAFAVLGGGNNVPARYTSDLWVANGYAYTGTWNWIQRSAGVQGTIEVFQLSVTGAPVLVDSVRLSNVITVSDLEVSPDGHWLVATAEGGSGGGVYVYDLTNPAHPSQVAFAPVATGLHTGSLSVINGTLYAFTAKDPSSCALIVFDLSAAATGSITTASTTPIPDHYCIHDTFVRDGYAFVFAWNEGLYIFDVGNGSHGGTPSVPVQVSKTGSTSALAFGGETHNGWWFWNPTNGQKRYLFIGQEGPGSVGASSSGDIHVVDVSDLTAPVEVAHFHMAGAGTHNFWIDEPNQRLYAAYYNGGVVALDISGSLTGDLASREIARIKPGGSGNTYVWGVMLYNGGLYASDMVSGLWQLGVP